MSVITHRHHSSYPDSTILDTSESLEMDFAGMDFGEMDLTPEGMLRIEKQAQDLIKLAQDMVAQKKQEEADAVKGQNCCKRGKSQLVGCLNSTKAGVNYAMYITPIVVVSALSATKKAISATLFCCRR